MRFTLAALAAGLAVSAQVLAGAVDDVHRLSSDIWRPNAPICKDKLGRAFPSKMRSNGECDDRDSVIFNGLLCHSGEESACTAVANSQDPAAALPRLGAWWRSPRIALADLKCDAPDGKCDSFSHDQGLGVMLAVVTKRADAAYVNRLNLWVQWIDANRPCVLGSEPLCVRGWPRVCRDDTEPPNWPLKGCSLRPGDLAMMQTVLSRLGLPLIPDPPPVSDTLSRFKDWAAPFVVGGAALNDLGYPTHLAGVGILILRTLPPKDDEKPVIDLAAVTLNKRQPRNPFFALLAGKRAEDVARLVLDLCPKTLAEIPKERLEWIWERKDGSDAPQRTMLWDCIFMSNMLRRIQ